MSHDCPVRPARSEVRHDGKVNRRDHKPEAIKRERKKGMESLETTICERDIYIEKLTLLITDVDLVLRRDLNVVSASWRRC